MIDDKKVILTIIPDHVLARKKKKYQLMTDRWLWNNMLAEKVLGNRRDS
jgi:hypothetical protein